MKKSELIAALGRDFPQLPVRDIETIVSTIFNEIANVLARGDRVELRGFGIFEVKHRRARTGRNPKTGASVPISEKGQPFFRAGKKLAARIADSALPEITNSQMAEM